MTSELISELKKWGCDTEGALRRLCSDSELYADLTKEYFSELNLSELEKAVSDKDCKAAFEIAHSIKGVAANLGITPICKPVNEVTDIFRAGSFENCEPLIEQIKELKNELDSILAKY